MYTFIDSIQDLRFLNQELLKKDFVGLDTEFRRTSKDNMKLALLQVNDGEEIYLIDTIRIDDPQENISFLFSERVTKVIHSCKEDLEAVFSWTHRKMVNVFDTQLADSLLGQDYSIGYQGLVEKKLDILLEKNETRSNWIRRPLTDSQLKYASLDVEYLPHLYIDQRRELVLSKKLQWHNEEIDKLIETTFSIQSDELSLRRTMSKSDENQLLERLNAVINEIADRENINSTFFFSKKSQKDFLRVLMADGFDKALGKITNWRKKLIQDDLVKLLK